MQMWVDLCTQAHGKQLSTGSLSEAEKLQKCDAAIIPIVFRKQTQLNAVIQRTPALMKRKITAEERTLSIEIPECPSLDSETLM